VVEVISGEGEVGWVARFVAEPPPPTPPPLVRARDVKDRSSRPVWASSNSLYSERRQRNGRELGRFSL
jgi:hypothetical protein